MRDEKSEGLERRSVTAESFEDSDLQAVLFLFREKSGQLPNPWRYSAAFCGKTTEEKLCFI
jgi:hypothetical protein